MYLVLFDCDGTLVDSQHHIVASMEAAFLAHGLERPAREKVLSIIGLSINEAVREICKGMGDLPFEEIGNSYKTAFSDLRASQAHAPEPLYEGALECLLMLKERDDVVVGMATGKSRRGVDNVVRLHDLDGHFLTIQTADTSPSKPHPDMILRAMAETGAKAENTLMIGDTTFDMMMARAAGVTGLGVTWGYHPGNALLASGAAQLFDRFHQLTPHLASHFAGEIA